MIIENYIATKQLDLDLVELKKSCYQMEDLVKRKFDNVDGSYAGGQVNESTKLFNKYNIFLYPYNQFYELYQEIRKVFFKIYENDHPEPHYIQSWVNIYHKGDYIDWHNHWPTELKSWHGFFCVDCEPSYTTYRLPNKFEPVNVESKNNLLVISKSAGDTHRTWPWEYADRDRITIAFDIVPRPHFNPEAWLNHWVPL